VNATVASFIVAVIRPQVVKTIQSLRIDVKSIEDFGRSLRRRRNCTQRSAIDPHLDSVVSVEYPVADDSELLDPKGGRMMGMKGGDLNSDRSKGSTAREAMRGGTLTSRDSKSFLKSERA
jgi:hypothetical protein